MRALVRLSALTAILLSALPAWAAAPVRQIYLIQNSGWMEPYFLDPQSQFLTLTERLIEATQLEGIDITVASFNQEGQLPGHHSPDVLLSGAYDPAAVQRVLTGLSVPRRPNGRYADADFLGALQATLGDLMQGGEGIIWMLSNNKNSPNNDQNIAENTRGFYDLLRNSPFITRILAYPLPMPVSGPNFSEKGFIVYGIAYGETAAKALDVIAGAQAPLRGAFADPPVFLKPVEPQTLELELAGRQVDEAASVAMENGIVVVDGLDAEAGSTLGFSGRLRNVAYPKKIASARISARWNTAAEGGGALAVAPESISQLAAGAVSEPIDFTLTVPAAERPPGLDGLFATQKTVDGEMTILLGDLAFDLDDRFVEKAAAVFGGAMMGEGQRKFVEQQLPAIFFDFRSISTSVTTVPIRMVFHFSAWPLYTAAASSVVLAGGLAALAFLLLRARPHLVEVAGQRQRLMLKPGQTLQVTGGDGRAHKVRGRLFGPPSISAT